MVSGSSLLSVTNQPAAKYDELTVSVSQHQVSLEIQMIKTAALEMNALQISWLVCLFFILTEALKSEKFLLTAAPTSKKDVLFVCFCLPVFPAKVFNFLFKQNYSAAQPLPLCSMYGFFLRCGIRSLRSLPLPNGLCYTLFCWDSFFFFFLFLHFLNIASKARQPKKKLCTNKQQTTLIPDNPDGKFRPCQWIFCRWRPAACLCCPVFVQECMRLPVSL